MQAQIKNYRECAGNEGPAFSCSLWIDGVKVAEVRYDGRGGPYMWRWLHDAANATWAAYVKAQPPMPPLHEGGEPLAINDDIALEDIFNAERERKQVTRWCKTNVVFRLTTDEPGVFHKFKGQFTPAVKERLGKQYGDQLLEIMNETLQG